MAKKNIKIDESYHLMLKEYCNATGYRMNRLIELFIERECVLPERKEKRVLLVD